MVRADRPQRAGEARMPFRHGALVGKFMPAHRGHQHFVRFACGMCDHVTVVVDRVPGEWPDADARAAAMRADLAGLPVTVVALSEVTPQEPSDHPDFWRIWRDLMVGACGGIPDALVCSMDYGLPLSEVIGCEFVPLDIGREAVPLCATDIRPDPWMMWDDMLPNARLAYLTRVAVEGPESTGKSTIARKVAEANDFGYAPEWAKTFIEQRVRAGRAFDEADLVVIARGQVAQERSLELGARRALICDSSLLTTLVWSQFLYGRVDPRIERLFEEEEARAPRKRWLFTPETPWIADVHRDVAADAGADETRRRFWEILVNEADRRGLPYQVVPGGFAEKEAATMALAINLSASAGWMRRATIRDGESPAP